MFLILGTNVKSLYCLKTDHRNLMDIFYKFFNFFFHKKGENVNFVFFSIFKNILENQILKYGLCVGSLYTLNFTAIVLPPQKKMLKKTIVIYISTIHYWPKIWNIFVLLIFSNFV